MQNDARYDMQQLEWQKVKHDLTQSSPKSMQHQHQQTSPCMFTTFENLWFLNYLLNVLFNSFGYDNSLLAAFLSSPGKALSISGNHLIKMFANATLN